MFGLKCKEATLKSPYQVFNTPLISNYKDPQFLAKKHFQGLKNRSVFNYVSAIERERGRGTRARTKLDGFIG